jgi:hypothetical protein
MTERVEARKWAREEFGFAELGHAARTKRLVTMAGGALRKPAGKVSEVYETDAQRQGAYDFLEGSQVSAEAVTAACVAASVKRCCGQPFVFVPVDGSSVSLTDREGKKGLGAVGAAAQGGRGLKVMTAYAVDARGVPIGIMAQCWWARTQKPTGCRKRKRARNAKRATKEKETQRWIDAIGGTVSALEGTQTRAWFQLDREGDSAPVLQALVASGHPFTVRASANRRLVASSPVYLRQRLARQRLLGTYPLEVASGPHRSARVARMSVRSALVQLRLRHPWSHAVTVLNVTAVWAHETSHVPTGEKPIDWLLLTSHEVRDFDEACTVIDGYATRWRIEELHKTWKTGACNVEDAQLRTKVALIKWLSILLAVATRIERLKQLARKSPDLPARAELQPTELRALVLLKRQQKKRTETVGDEPTIAEAVRWLADLGGYTGKSSGGPPGSITIGRGLHDVLVAAAAIQAISDERHRK